MDISCSETGCPPVLINANGIEGGQAEISGQISSQFLSALLMTGPLAKGKISLKIKDELMSAPYVHMTINLMKKFGVSVHSEADRLFEVSPGRYKSPGTYFIEGDASSASYFLAGAAITGGPVTVVGCGSDSVQVLNLLHHLIIMIHLFPNSMSRVTLGLLKCWRRWEPMCPSGQTASLLVGGKACPWLVWTKTAETFRM